MATLTDKQIASYASAAGFKGTGLQISIAVALAESGGNPNATNQNKNGSGQVTSTDRGLWQINNVYHSEVTDACAFNPACAASSAYRISAGGSNWTPWTTYTNGAYQKYMSRASTAIGSGSGSTPTNTVLPPPVAAGTPLTVPATPNQFGLLQGTTDSYPQSQVYAYKGSNLSQAIFGPLNMIIAIVLVLAVFIGIGRTRWGYVALYYGEGLILLFLFATQAQYIKQHLSVLTGIGSQNETNYVSELAVRTSPTGVPMQPLGNSEFSPVNPNIQTL